MPTYVNTTGGTTKLTKSDAPPSSDWIPLEEWQKQKEESKKPHQPNNKEK